MFKDKDGKLSSKRVTGFAMVCIAVVGGFAGSIFDNAMMVDFSKWLILGGALPVMAGVFERKTEGI